MDITRENLAAYAHDAWSRWMRYLFSKSNELENSQIVIPSDLVIRWQKRRERPYIYLSEKKKSDRSEAEKMISIFEIEKLKKEFDILFNALLNIKGPCSGSPRKDKGRECDCDECIATRALLSIGKK